MTPTERAEFASKVIEYAETNLSQGNFLILTLPHYGSSREVKITPKLWNSWKDFDGRGYLIAGKDGLYMRRGKYTDFCLDYHIQAFKPIAKTRKVKS
jgi:hypothetical protein